MDKGKILKILIIAILIIFFIMGCLAIYKFNVINKIFNKMGEYVIIENYHMKVINSENESEIIEVYYKNGVGKLLNNNGTYTWTDGNEAYLVNDEKKEIEAIDLNSPLLISNEYVGSMVPGYSKSILQKFVLAGRLDTSVKVKNYNDIKYYVITTNENEITKTIWFQYESLIPSQAKIKIGNIEQIFNYNITFNEVKDEDIQRPNIDEYTLVE